MTQRLPPPCLLAALLLGACASNHHVSPFPDLTTLGELLPPPDLSAQVKRLDDEARLEGYELATELGGKLRDGGEIVVRGYDLLDPLGRTVHATRVATPSGIVLALGPPDPKELAPRACRLVPSLVEGGWRSGTDLNGDGAPDVVVADGRGLLGIWRIEGLGATPIPIELTWPATYALDANGDGFPDFAATLPTDDVIAPALVDVAIFDGARYTNGSADAKRWHGAERDAAAERLAKRDETKDVRGAARAAIERAFHAGMAGDDGRLIVAALDAFAAKRASPGDGIDQAWRAWRRFVEERFAPPPRQRTGAPAGPGVPDGG